MKPPFHPLVGRSVGLDGWSVERSVGCLVQRVNVKADGQKNGVIILNVFDQSTKHKSELEKFAFTFQPPLSWSPPHGPLMEYKTLAKKSAKKD